MRGPLRVVAVVLLSFALGLHWAALQSVAWTSMFLERVQDVSIGEALRTTRTALTTAPLLAGLCAATVPTRGWGMIDG